MGDESTVKTNDAPNYPPGTLIGVEWYKDDKVPLDPEEQNALKELIRDLSNRDMAARREEVILIWKKRLYDRGFQHLLPQRNGGWQLPAVGTGYNPQDVNSRSMFVTNIYTPYRETIAAALTREIPTSHFGPVDPDSDIDITAAEGANKLEDKIDRDNDLRGKMEDMSRYLWTDGRAMFLATFQKDGQQFGYESDDPEAVPEDEEAMSQEETSEQESSEGESVESSSQETSEEDSGTSTEGGEGETGSPRSREVIEVDGALEWKVPIKANSLAECSYAIRSREIDLQIAKARYPDAEADLRPSQGGPGGDDIDRLARINVRLGVMDNYNTTDMMIHDTTEQKTFLRRAALLAVEDKTLRASLLKKFSRGAYVTFCGETFCEAYNHTMDEHVTMIFARSGDGAHRSGLGDWLVPIQEVLNNWMELANDYFVRGVPNKWMDNEMFNVEALKDQVNIPGSTHPFDREPNVTMEEVIWEETPIQFPSELTGFIDNFAGELPQLLCGAFPALSGGGDSSPTDTMGGMMIQRDQALGRIGLPWRRIKEGIPNVKKQAIVLLAKNYEEAITITGSEAVTIEMESLRGNFRAFPETDENFPVSYTQKQNRLAQLFTDAATNPQIGELIYSADNLEQFKNGLGLEDFYIPQIEAREKQLGEATILLKAEPVPNPQLAQAQTQLKALQAQGLAAAQTGGQPDPQIVAQAQQLQQAIAKMPPQVSSVPIDEECDDHPTEAATSLKIINSPRGREMKNGTPEEQAGIFNLRLHYLEHKAALAKIQATQPGKGKPPSVSIALKDLPAPEAAAAATMAGIPARVGDFQQAEAAEAVAKHPGSISVQ